MRVVPVAPLVIGVPVGCFRRWVRAVPTRWAVNRAVDEGLVSAPPVATPVVVNPPARGGHSRKVTSLYRGTAPRGTHPVVGVVLLTSALGVALVVVLPRVATRVLVTHPVVWVAAMTAVLVSERLAVTATATTPAVVIPAAPATFRALLVVVVALGVMPVVGVTRDTPLVVVTPKEQ